MPESEAMGEKQMKGRNRGKNQDEINYIYTIIQIKKHTAWTNSLPVDETSFLDSAASIHLLHNRAQANKAKHQEEKTSNNSKRVEYAHYGDNRTQNQKISQKM